MKRHQYLVALAGLLFCLSPAFADNSRSKNTVNMNGVTLDMALDQYSQQSAKAMLVSPDIHASTNLLTFHFDGPADGYVPELENALLGSGVRLVSVGTNLVKAIAVDHDTGREVMLPPPLVPPRQDRADTKVEMKFLDAPIQMLLDEYTKITGVSVQSQDQFSRIPVTFQSRIRLSAHEQLQALECLLRMRGILLVRNPDDSITAVVQSRDKQEAQQKPDGDGLKPAP